MHYFYFYLHSIECGGRQSAHANFNRRNWNTAESHWWLNISILHIWHVFADKTGARSVVVCRQFSFYSIFQMIIPGEFWAFFIICFYCFLGMWIFWNRIWCNWYDWTLVNHVVVSGFKISAKILPFSNFLMNFLTSHRRWFANFERKHFKFWFFQRRRRNCLPRFSLRLLPLCHQRRRLFYTFSLTSLE